MSNIKYFFISISLCFTIFARTNEDNQTLFQKIPDFYPEINDVLKQADFHNSVSFFVPNISSMNPTGINSIPQHPLSSKELARLKEMNINNTKVLLELKSLPLIFEMLVKALKEDDSFKAAFWAACLNNNISNYTDLTSFPEVDYLADYIPTLIPDLLTLDNKAVSMRGSASSSFNDTFRYEFASKYYESIVAKTTIQVITKDSGYITEFLLNRPASLLRVSQKHANYFSLNLERAALSSDKTNYNGTLAVLKSSLLSVITCAEIIKTAKLFANEKIEYKSPSSNDLKTTLANSQLSIPLDASLYLKPVYDQQKENGTIGLVVEAISPARQPLLGKEALLLTSQIGHSLNKKKIDYSLLELETTMKTGFPSPIKMPIIIIPSTKYTFRSGWMSISKLEQHLMTYKNKGGRIIWIGDKQIRSLGDLATKISPIPSSIRISEGEKEELKISPLISKQDKDTFIDIIRVPSQFNNIIQTGSLVNLGEGITSLFSYVEGDEEISLAAVSNDKSTTYINPLFLFPGALDKNVEKLIPTPFQSDMDTYFANIISLILDPNKL